MGVGAQQLFGAELVVDVHALRIERAIQLGAGPFANAFVRIILGEKLFGGRVDRVVDHAPDQVDHYFRFARARCGENLLPFFVEDLALMVHHFVVFEQVLADTEIAFFDLLLRAFDAATHLLVFDLHAVFKAEALEEFQHALAHEVLHKRIAE